MELYASIPHAFVAFRKRTWPYSKVYVKRNSICYIVEVKLKCWKLHCLCASEALTERNGKYYYRKTCKILAQ
jgi:hypothetical protein